MKTLNRSKGNTTGSRKSPRKQPRGSMRRMVSSTPDAFAPNPLPNDKALAQAKRSLDAVSALLRLRPSLDVGARKTLRGDAITRDEVVPIAQEIAAHNVDVVGDHFDAAKVEACTEMVRSLEPVLEACSALSLQLLSEIERHKAIVGVECRDLYNYLRAIAPTPRGQAIREPLGRWITALKRHTTTASKPAAKGAGAPSADAAHPALPSSPTK